MRVQNMNEANHCKPSIYTSSEPGNFQDKIQGILNITSNESAGKSAQHESSELPPIRSLMTHTAPTLQQFSTNQKSSGSRTLLVVNILSTGHDSSV